MAEEASDPREHAPAAERNRDAILAVLATVLPAQGLVLEIGSGTGQHVVHFAKHLPGLTWQPSEVDTRRHASIAAWIDAERLSNVRRPLLLDVLAPAWPMAQADAIVCINVIHIAPWTVTHALFAGAARVLGPRGVVVLYGPYREHGQHTAPSNARFDQDLRARNGEWGVRDLDEVTEVASRHGFMLEQVVPMPTNNLSVVFRRPPEAHAWSG